MKYPNILVVMVDQLAWKALPYYGDNYAETPNINRICKDGIGFDASYCPFPLCQPARASLWTGVYPHETRVLSNGRHWPVAPVPENIPTLGEVFSNAGYKTVHFGKTHDAGALRGFECVPVEEVEVEQENDAWPLNRDTFRDRDTANKAVDFLQKNDTEPYLMIVDFVNPHNICNWIGVYRDKHQDVDPKVPLPELPENFDFDDIENRALPVQYICCSHNRQAMTGEWDDDSFRYYLAAYYHYLHRVDAEIGRVLDALESRADRENTLIVFMSDHGDGMAARRRVTKQVDLYEEVTRVPFIFNGPGIKPGPSIKEYPVSTLDLFPTLCGYAGVKKPETLRGVDLSPVLLGTDEQPKRAYVASEWHTEWGYTVSPGRMIRTERYKYIHYLEGNYDELYDLQKDPYEKINQAKNPHYAEILATMKQYFEDFLQRTDDDYRSLQVKAGPRWRSHKVGYQYHRGPAAPEFTDPATGKRAAAEKKGE